MVDDDVRMLVVKNEGPITSSATPVLESGVAVLLSGGLARTATVV